jgi:phosphatidate cytidylyltransferase
MNSESTLMNKNLALRLVTGVSGSAFLIFMMVYKYQTFTFIVGLMAFLLLYEFYIMTEKFKPLKWLGLALGMSVYVLALLYNQQMLDNRILAFFVLLVLSVPIVLLFDKERNIFESLSITYLGTFYIALPLALLVLIASPNELVNETGFNRFMILGIFLVIWSNDTGAYFAGKTMGKTKLFERVSPNKTVEGSIGGVVLAFVIITIYIKFFVKADYSLVWWYLFTAVISFAGIIGDLIESQMKRTLGIKDSGNLIPGHGGVLDRFDALIFSLPFAYICYLLV